MINIALPKGRLGEKVYSMFEAAGYECPSIKENNRKLIFENSDCGVRYFWVKPSDVAIYVERGAADIGVAGNAEQEASHQVHAIASVVCLVVIVITILIADSPEVCGEGIDIGTIVEAEALLREEVIALQTYQQEALRGHIAEERGVGARQARVAAIHGIGSRGHNAKAEALRGRIMRAGQDTEIHALVGVGRIGFEEEVDEAFAKPQLFLNAIRSLHVAHGRIYPKGRICNGNWRQTIGLVKLNKALFCLHWQHTISAQLLANE